MSKNNKTRYRELAKRYPFPLFMQPDWMDAVSNNWDVALVEKENNILGVWVYTLEKKIGLTLIRNPFLTPYLGPYFFLPEKLSAAKKIHHEEKLIAELFRQIPKWDFMDVMTVPGFNNFLPFHHLGFSNSQRLTYHISLQQDENTLWNNIDSRKRNMISKAEKELKITDARPYLKHFFDLHKETLTSKGTTIPYDELFFKKLITNHIENDTSYFNVVLDNQDNFVGALFCPYDSTTMYLLISAVDKRLQQTGAIAFLIWDALKFARQKGLKIFDFEGSMNKGIEEFFRCFGGNRVSYLHFQAHKSALWKLREALRKS